MMLSLAFFAAISAGWAVLPLHDDSESKSTSYSDSRSYSDSDSYSASDSYYSEDGKTFSYSNDSEKDHGRSHPSHYESYSYKSTDDEKDDDKFNIHDMRDDDHFEKDDDKFDIHDEEEDFYYDDEKNDGKFDFHDEKEENFDDDDGEEDKRSFRGSGRYKAMRESFSVHRDDARGRYGEDDVH